MYDGNNAALKLVTCFREGEEPPKDTWNCTVIEYQKETEQVHLLMTEGKLPDISLDSIYECRIQTMTGEVVCVGGIKERYENRAGMILILQILNGFYELSINH